MGRLHYLVDLYRKAFGAYTWQVILIALLAFVSSIAEGIGISALIPVFSFVGGDGGGAGDTVSRLISTFFKFFHVTYSFRTLLMFIAGLFVARVGLLFLIRYITGKIIYAYECDLRSTLFKETLGARWPYLSKQRIGNLEQLLTTNTKNASQFFGTVATSALIGTKLIIYMLVAVNISWWIMILSVPAGICAFLVLRPLFYYNRSIAVKAEYSNRDLAHFVGEHIIGMKAIKAMGLEASVERRGNSLFERIKNLNFQSMLLLNYVETIVNVGAVIFVGVIFVIMYRSPGFSIAAFAVIVYAINQIFAQIQAAQAQLHTISSLVPYIAEAFRYNEDTKEHQEHQGGTGQFSFADQIEFRDVSFEYPERGAVLENIRFAIKRGELLGIVGPSGSGKTTIADLLLRLEQPTAGVIYADSRDIREIRILDWRTHVGYVAQDAVLLNDTLEQNIRFYNPKLSREDIVEAATYAHIHDFIQTLPEGYQTIVGDRGILLSGGQRQRVALARVLARKPQLLVLDEATSSLDAESERAIQTAIEALHGDITVIVIAHRLTTLSGADRIIVLSGGHITEIGTPQELLAQPNSYFSETVRREPYAAKVRIA